MFLFGINPWDASSRFQEGRITQESSIGYNIALLSKKELIMLLSYFVWKVMHCITFFFVNNC